MVKDEVAYEKGLGIAVEATRSCEEGNMKNWTAIEKKWAEAARLEVEHKKTFGNDCVANLEPEEHMPFREALRKSLILADPFFELDGDTRGMDDCEALQGRPK